MADSLVLHVGAPKTATSTIQSCLAAMRDDLADRGVLYPGPDINQVPEFLAPLQFPAPKHMEDEAPDRWKNLLRSIRKHRGTVVLSSEIVSSASVEQGRAVVDQMDVDDTRVIITVRSLHSLLPSTWQEYVKAGDTIGYSEWLEKVFSGPPVYETHQFWIANNLADLVDRWVRIVGAPNVTVIVLDPLDNDRIYRDFESILGLPHEYLRHLPQDLTNRSMTAGESELVRRLNLELNGHQPGRHGYKSVPLQALWDMLRRQPQPHELRLGLDDHQWRRADELSGEFVERISRSGCRVVGSLGDLRPDRGTSRSAPGESTDISDDAAIALAAALVRLIHTME